MSERLDELEVETVRLGEVHRHLGAAIADGDGSAARRIDGVARGLQQRMQGEGAGTVRSISAADLTTLTASFGLAFRF